MDHQESTCFNPKTHGLVLLTQVPQESFILAGPGCMQMTDVLTCHYSVLRGDFGSPVDERQNLEQAPSCPQPFASSRTPGSMETFSEAPLVPLAPQKPLPQISPQHSPGHAGLHCPSASSL